MTLSFLNIDHIVYVIRARTKRIYESAKNLEAEANFGGPLSKQLRRDGKSSLDRRIVAEGKKV